MSVSDKKKAECCGCNSCVEICPKHIPEHLYLVDLICHGIFNITPIYYRKPILTNESYHFNHYSCLQC